MDLRGRIAIPIIGLLLLMPGCFSAGAGQEQAEGALEPKLAAGCVAVEDSDKLADQVLQITNLERAAADLPPVVSSDRLGESAAKFACRMIEEGFFDHYDPETGRGPGERAVTAKYIFYSIGENLAAGQETAADVMRVWMESPSHRSIILDPAWKDVGIAVRSLGGETLYWVVEFGDPVEFPISGTR